MLKEVFQIFDLFFLKNQQIYCFVGTMNVFISFMRAYEPSVGIEIFELRKEKRISLRIIFPRPKRAGSDKNDHGQCRKNWPGDSFNWI